MHYFELYGKYFFLISIKINAIDFVIAIYNINNIGKK